MSHNLYTDECRAEAVKQVAERGHPVADVAARLGVSIHSLYAYPANRWVLQVLMTAA